MLDLVEKQVRVCADKCGAGMWACVRVLQTAATPPRHAGAATPASGWRSLNPAAGAPGAEYTSCPYCAGCSLVRG